MRVFLTGATGTVGSAVVADLVGSGHQVTAAVRSAEAAAAVTALGGTPVAIALSDATGLAEAIAQSDAAIYAAAPTTAPDAANAAFVTASLAAAGTDRPIVLTSGTWVYGSGEIVDHSALNPAELVAWRIRSEEALLAGSSSATVLAPGIVHGATGGLYETLVNGPRDDLGRRRLIGEGSQRWSWVHAQDLAALYRLVIENGIGQGRMVAAQTGPPVRDLVRDAAGADGVLAETVDETRLRFGTEFGDALLLDQAVEAKKARSLGWRPVHGLPGRRHS
ncbi:NAD(P)H-binding protein [Microbacterium saperdae]